MSEPTYPGLLEEGGEEESYGTAESMDPGLYRATIEGDILEFIKAMEHGQLYRQYHSSAGCVQLGPQKNIVLHIATSSGNYEIVKLLCKDLPFYVAGKNSKGDTPLHVAARAEAGYVDLVKLLMDNPVGNCSVEGRFRNKSTVHAAILGENIATDMDGLESCWCSAISTRKVSKTRKISSAGQNSELENYKDKVNVVLLVANLIAAVTFTAGFTVPGGYNNSTQDQGMATMLTKVKFQEFVFCDTVAMYSSIIVTVTLIWAQLGDLNSMHVALKLAVPLLGNALAMMSIAFIAGVYLVVSKLSWLGNFILVMGSNFLIALTALFVPLCFLGSSNYRVLCRLPYFPFRLLLYAFGSFPDRDEKEV
ncbi:hypothetical protein Vadar_019089 [Vaccinium darrowii]|uniref:Uncharacterized protein n=1 Tax=Vaccinium darrowii TaxID=229202 RepID=A0ACB7Z6B7_9ERIC|nr:hypothetical protein Vadar_019089 [Vaccinium darrowii]